MAFKASYTGLCDLCLVEHGVTGNWSVRDIIAHVTTWDEEALRHLPLILKGGKPPRYSVTYGGIDAFNAVMTERKKDFSLTKVLTQLDETHSQLIALIQSTPEDQFIRETRFRHRLRLDTYSHYPKHAEALVVNLSADVDARIFEINVMHCRFVTCWPDCVAPKVCLKGCSASLAARWWARIESCVRFWCCSLVGSSFRRPTC